MPVVYEWALVLLGLPLIALHLYPTALEAQEPAAGEGKEPQAVVAVETTVVALEQFHQKL